MKRALISVSNKTGLIEFARKLVSCGVEIVSTSGTARAIKDAGLPCTLVEDITGFPEMLNGRVKCLHPNIFAGIIADQNDPEHMTALAERGILPFHLVVVNLYDFEGHPSVEQIDVGGPSMLQAAAKNFNSVAAVVDHNDYDWVAQQVKALGHVPEESRFVLAKNTFRALAHYEQVIANHFDRCVKDRVPVEAGVKH